jgi:hypothetical protein
MNTCCDFYLWPFVGWYDGAGRCDEWHAFAALLGPDLPGLSTVSCPLVLLVMI